MNRHNTNLMFITYVGTQAGTSMAQAIKAHARSCFDHTIIDRSQVDDVVKELQARHNAEGALHPRWKSVSIEREESKGLTNMHYIQIEGESILFITPARCSFVE